MKIKEIQTDQGEEFVIASLREYLTKEGINHRFSYAYTPQQHGLVEKRLV